MCGDNITVFVIGRMLYRCKLLDFFPYRKNDDSTWMLTCGTSDTGTALNNTVDLAVSFVLTTLLVIILHITESSFFCKCTNGTCFKSLTLTKNNLCISVCICLIFTGKVQVNIRLFISFESQESLKRNIKPFFVHLGSTVRANLVRHVTSCHTTEFLYFR